MKECKQEPCQCDGQDVCQVGEDKKKKMKTRPQTLQEVINALPDDTAVGVGDVKQMALQFILDTPEDQTDRAYRSRLKLEALKILADLVKREGAGDIQDAVLMVINGKGE